MPAIHNLIRSNERKSLANWSDAQTRVTMAFVHAAELGRTVTGGQTK